MRNKGYGNYITLRIEYLLDAKEALKQKCQLPEDRL